MGKWLVMLCVVVVGLLGWSGLASAQEKCPFTISGEIAAGDASQNGRLKNGPESLCATPKVVPDFQVPIQARRFDSYTLRNRSNATACVGVTVTATTAGVPVSSAAYLGSFDPQNIQTNYLGDSGNTADGSKTYSFNVPALASFVVTVTEVGNGGGAYTLAVADCGSVVASSVAPNAGPVAGGTAVTISGSGFEAGATVTIGGIAATNVVIVDEGSITATTPAGTAGTASIVVTNPGGASSTLPNAFSYVAPAATTLTLASNVNPAIIGQSVTFTATATSAAGTPSGDIVFKDGTATLGTVALGNTGVAELTTANLAIGTHAITATYAGNATFEAAASAVVSQVVTTGRTTTVLTSSANPTVAGNTVHFTIVVSATSPATGIPTGNVTVSAGGTPVSSATALDANGRATVSTSSLVAGTHAIVATYAGDAKFASSVSAPLSLRVDARVGSDGGSTSSSSGATSSGATSSGGSADAGVDGLGGDASGGGGCDCRTASGAAAPSALAWALAVTFALSRRRRRSSRDV